MLGLMNSWAAISRLVSPYAARREICSSCGVSWSIVSLIDLGGNDGGGTTGPWLAAWELPNTITCDDRPPLVPPPPASPW